MQVREGLLLCFAGIEAIQLQAWDWLRDGCEGWSAGPTCYPQGNVLVSLVTVIRRVILKGINPNGKERIDRPLTTVAGMQPQQKHQSRQRSIVSQLSTY